MRSKAQKNYFTQVSEIQKMLRGPVNLRFISVSSVERVKPNFLDQIERSVLKFAFKRAKSPVY